MYSTFPAAHPFADPRQATILPQSGHILPELWPEGYRTRALSLGADNPLLRMGTEHPFEHLPDAEALADPTGEHQVSPLPFLLHKHPDRALVLTTSECFFHCRFCFRRGSAYRSGPGREDWQAILDWLHRHPQVREVILSGGDPLTLDDDNLARIARQLERIPHLSGWRIHTRAPVVFPQRVTRTLVDALHGSLPLRVVVHLNHSQELTLPVTKAFRRLQKAGHPLLCQSVLLNGVNDCSRTLAQLFCRLRDLEVVPHYLHHPDRAPGNHAFRLPISRGKQVVRACRQELLSTSGRVPMPPYVIDLPNGAGKCPVEDLRVVATRSNGIQSRLRYRWVRPQDWHATVGDTRYEWWDISQPKPGVKP